MKKNALKWTIVAGLLLIAGNPPSTAGQMICVTITGETQGDFIGEHPVSLCELQIEAFEFHHLVDADAGGSLQHRTAIFTKPIDSTTVKLWRAWDTRERLDVALKFYRPVPGGGGTIEQYYTIALVGAVVDAIEPHVPDVLDPDLVTLVPNERLRLTYDQITMDVMGATATLDN